MKSRDVSLRVLPDTLSTQWMSCTNPFCTGSSGSDVCWSAIVAPALTVSPDTAVTRIGVVSENAVPSVCVPTLHTSVEPSSATLDAGSTPSTRHAGGSASNTAP
ncbi:Uncharacterised protein [Mycobacteroides abscessus]|nr:Uncharacterised protein [Mycobacteroides abscessus]